MLQVNSAVSGEAIDAISLDDYEGTSVKDLKKSLVKKTGCNRFRQRCLRQDHSECLDEEPLNPGIWQLVVLPLLEAHDVEAMKLLNACRRQDVEAVEAFLRQPRDPNVCDKDGMSALECAVTAASLPCVRLLLEADVDLNKPAADGSGPLHWAVKAGSVEVAQLLVDSGADKNSALHNGSTPLHLAAISEGTSRNMLVSLLIEAGFDVNAANSQKAMPLHWASNTGDDTQMQLLINAKAEINCVTSRGESPLCMAARSGSVEAVRLLLDSSAKVNLATEIGAIPLHYAATEGHVDMIRLLMASRADVKAKTDRGETPLDMATASAQYALIAGWQRSAASRWAGKKTQTLVHGCSLDHVLNALYPRISYYTLFTSDSCIVIHSGNPYEPAEWYGTTKSRRGVKP